MIGNVVQSLFSKGNNAPLAAAVSVVSMMTITIMVCIFLWSVGRNRVTRREI
jgi:spermidine/putrescine transport system permease protein